MSSAGRASLGAALILALTACTPALAGSASPGEDWPDLYDPPFGRLDGRADAAVIVVIDDPALDGRPGAWEVGSGWWRYFVRTRGLRARRVRLLRNEEASASAIQTEITRMKDRAGTGSMLWLIYIGGGTSPTEGRGGRLHAGDGQVVEFEALHQQLSIGYHESALLVLDACASKPEPSWRAGIPASPPTPLPVVDPPLPYALSVEAKGYNVLYGSGMAAAVARARAQVQVDVHHEQTARRNTFLLTAGTGDECVTTLADRSWPALAYAALAGLQGWSDLDEDGWIAARELAIYAQAVVTELDRPPCRVPTRRVEAAGVDLILADVAGFAPRPARIAWKRRRAEPIDPGLAGRSPESLREAAEFVDFDLEDMVAVPRGRFHMGCDKANDKDCERDEFPRHQVQLGGYAIDRTEVTWAAYRACVTSGACETMRLRGCWVWTGEAFLYGAELPPAMLADDHPVVCVNWMEAATYCNAVGKRLPTEAEWERAARGVDGRLYPWGDEPPSCKLAAMDGCDGFTQAVGSYPNGASPVGALDMTGNVTEWIFDWWDEISYQRSGWPNPTGPDTGEVRVTRGGSFYDGEIDLRASYRYGLEPQARISTLGFRCAR